MVSRIKLPKLEKKEEAAVTSSVIDVFYNPPKKPVSPVLGELARSLSGVVPQLQAYEDVQEEIEKTEEESKADVDFRNENIKDFRKLVKSGKIKEGSNPYYIQQYVKNTLKEKSTVFEAELWDEYKKQDIKSNINSSAFNDFYRQFASDFAAKHRLDLYDDVLVAEGFIPYAEAIRSQLQNQHINGRVAEIEKDQKETLRVLVENSIFDNQDIDENELDRALVNFPNLEGLDYEEKQTLYIAQTIQKEIDDLIFVGMDAKVANDLVVQKVIDIAKTAGNEDILNVLQNIVTDKKSDSRLAQSYKEDILQTIFEIQDIRDSRDAAKKRQREDAKKLRKEEVLNYFVYQDANMFDIEKAIADYNVLLANKGELKLTFDEVVTLRALSKSFIDGLQDENIIPSEEGTAFIKQLNTDLATNPQHPTLVSRIQKGLDEKYYSTADFKSYLTAYYSRSKLETSPYFTDLRFDQIKSAYTRSANSVAKSLGLFAEEHVEIVSHGELQLFNFAYGLLEDLQDKAYLDQNKLLTENQKRNHFFKLLEEERVRVIDIVLPTSIGAMRTESDKIKENIISGNPYKPEE